MVCPIFIFSHELLTTPSVGAMNLVKHLVKKEIKQGRKCPRILSQKIIGLRNISESVIGAFFFYTRSINTKSIFFLDFSPLDDKSPTVGSSQKQNQVESISASQLIKMHKQQMRGGRPSYTATASAKPMVRTNN